MTCRAARQGLPLVGSSHDLNAEIDWLAAHIAGLRRQIEECERYLAEMMRERRDRMLKPAPGAGEKETQHG